VANETPFFIVIDKKNYLNFVIRLPIDYLRILLENLKFWGFISIFIKKTKLLKILVKILKKEKNILSSWTYIGRITVI
jgi:hypothetical protein